MKKHPKFLGRLPEADCRRQTLNRRTGLPSRSRRGNLRGAASGNGLPGGMAGMFAAVGLRRDSPGVYNKKLLFFSNFLLTEPVIRPILKLNLKLSFNNNM